MLATYRSYRGFWTASGAVCCQPTGLIEVAELASGAVCWQPTGLIEVAEPPLGLYVGKPQVLWRLLNRLWGCMLATYRSDGGCGTASGAVCWQPTGLMEVAQPDCWTAFGAVCWQPNRPWGWMLATYWSVGGCWTASGAAGWQPTGLEVSQLNYGDFWTAFGSVWWQPTVTTFEYVEGGPDRKAPEVVWNTSSYIWMQLPDH